MVRLGLAVPAWILAVLFDIAGTLFKGEVYVPLLFENEDGMVHGNDWANGFMRGMGMRHEGWAELVNDEEHGGCPSLGAPPARLRGWRDLQLVASSPEVDRKPHRHGW